MSLDPVLEHVKKEWRVIAGAPWTFAAAVLVVGGLVWWIVDLRYSDTIEAKNATIQLLEKKTDGSGQKGTCPARLEAMGPQGEGKDQDGHATISRLFRVSGPAPYAVRFEASGAGFVDLKVIQRDWKRTENIAVQKIRNGKIITVNEPRGLYEVKVIALKDANSIVLTSKIQCEG